MKVRMIAATLAVAATTATTALLAPAGASASPALDKYLDAPRTNESAMHVGGVNPEFSTDPAELGALLDEARADGIAPKRYAALLHQYWLTTATSKANLDLNRWDPQLGLAANVGNLQNTFSYYEKLQRDHDDFLWTGQGGMAGPSFGAGIMDVDMGRVVLGVGQVRDAVAGIVATLDNAAAPATAKLNEDLQAILDVGHEITADDIAHFQVDVIGMSKHIFMDLIPQHEAFLAGGLDAIDEYYDAGLIDDRSMEAWRDLASGDPDKVVEGNKDLLWREQYQTIGDQWDTARNYKGSVGRALTYLSTVAADPAIPGLEPPREYAPLTLTATDLNLNGGAVANWHMQTPLPAFNWSERDARWKYIMDEMLPTYRGLKEHNPDLWRATLDKPMQQQFLEQRALIRLPQMLTSMARVTKPYRA